MSEPFIAEVRIFAGNFAPRNWALCNGALLPIAQNTALFSLIGTIYGGDGRTTCGLPNLQGRVPLHKGNGPGLTPRQQGSMGGSETVTLTTNELPAHTHQMTASSSPAEAPGPGAGNALARSVGGALYGPPSALVPLGPDPLPQAGGGGAHTNLQPYLVMNFIIALQGVYPTRS